MTSPAPSADLLARLARRFGDNPGHAAWVARVAGGQPQELLGPPDDGVVGIPPWGLQAGEDAQVGGVVLVGHAREPEAVPVARQALPRGGHTELALERLKHEDARIRRGGGLPAVWSAYS